MTKGQRAMAVAKIYPQAEKGGRGKKSITNIEFGVSLQYVSFARTVLQHAPDLAAGVLAQSRPGRRTAPSRLSGYQAAGAPIPATRAPRAPWAAPVRAVAGIHNLLTDIGQRMSAPGG